MALRTRFTDLTGCALPIQQAPMGAVSSPELVAAAVEAGAVGTVGLTGYPVELVEEILGQIEALTSGFYGGNFVLPLVEETDPILACAERANFVDLYHSAPDSELVSKIKSAGAMVCWQVGSVDEAVAAADCGVDWIAVRGTEGGGRMHGNRALWPLLCDVLNAVGDDTPVLAAGGIGTGRGLAAALAAGADGARIGTVLVATDESAAHPLYKEALVAADAADSVLTDEFSTGWPGGPHPSRVLRQCIDAARAFDGEIVGTWSIGGGEEEIPVFSPPPPTIDFSGEIGAMPLYAGESVTFATSIRAAGDVIAEIASDAEELIARLGS